MATQTFSRCIEAITSQLGGYPLVVRRAERGAILVELTLTLPIFLLLTYFLLFFAYAMNVRAQLTSATFNAPILAVTRGNQSLYSGEMITGFVVDPGDSKFQSIFKHPITGVGEPPDWQNTILENWAIYPDDYAGLNYNLNDPQVPKIYPYALAYVYQQAKLGIGPGIRFACLPNKEPENAGCLNCRISLSAAELSRFGVDNLGNIYDPPQIGISCVYQFPAFFSRPISGLLSIFGGSFEEVTTSVSTYESGGSGSTGTNGNGSMPMGTGNGSIPIGTGSMADTPTTGASFAMVG